MQLNQLIACLIILSAAIHRAASLECLVAVDFSQQNYSEPCASFHTGCFERIQLASDERTLVYEAHCAKGDECKQDPSNCLVCSGADRCNTGLLKRVEQKHSQCYSYSGDVRQIFYGDKKEYVPQVKEEPAYCGAGINSCHRIELTEPDPNFATGYSDTPNKVSLMAGCGKFDCRTLQFVSGCLICVGQLCNSLQANEIPVGFQSDQASGVAPVACGLSESLLLLAAAALAAVQGRQQLGD
ncbi:hypothetical protein BOX15_Mlig001695g1 [Macrostomum lignano]|uniref:DUF753 domain-containing protein n=2 Tax=Macrostomum lignano TaxID=282301 RepID=A0A1I8H9V5_9PLAT|nr:hypothetical protein BOX15_Mlig001695g2 [Macrostomum lignano]PAA65235.1 hypothetical protein BOX15_Mlig001695g1 [Macrostomum lignano]